MTRHRWNSGLGILLVFALGLFHYSEIHAQGSNGGRRYRRQVPYNLSPVMEYPPNTQFTKDKIPIFDGPYSKQKDSHYYTGPNGFARYGTFVHDPYNAEDLRRAFVINLDRNTVTENPVQRQYVNPDLVTEPTSPPTRDFGRYYVDPDSVTEPTSAPRRSYVNPNSVTEPTSPPRRYFNSNNVDPDSVTEPTSAPRPINNRWHSQNEIRTTQASTLNYDRESHLYQQQRQTQLKPMDRESERERFNQLEVNALPRTALTTSQPSRQIQVQRQSSQTFATQSPNEIATFKDRQLFHDDDSEESEEVPSRGDNRMTYRRRVSESRRKDRWGTSQNQDLSKPQLFDGQVITEVLDVRAESNLPNPQGFRQTYPRSTANPIQGQNEFQRSRGPEPVGNSWPRRGSELDTAGGPSPSETIDLESQLYTRTRNEHRANQMPNLTPVRATSSPVRTYTARPAPSTASPGRVTPIFEPNYPTLFEKETADRASVPNQVLVRGYL